MPPDLHNAKKKKAHGQLRKCISQNGEGISDISPEDRVRTISNAKFPEILTQSMVHGDLDENGETEQEDLMSISLVTSPVL